MERLELECRDYNQGFVFKRCSIYIVVLEKPIENFKCNESRNNVEDANYAKFRGNFFIVKDIINGETYEHIEKITHRNWFCSPTVYEVGKETFPDSFNENLNEICTHGIHYFLTLLAAYSYEYLPQNGIWHCFGDSGKLECKGGFINGKLAYFFEKKSNFTEKVQINYR